MSAGVVFDLPEADYHQHPAWSSSKAKSILDSPAHYKWEYIDGNRQVKKAFDVGSAVHAKVLGTGYAVRALDFDNFRTKAAQDARDEARAAGEIPILKKELEPIDAMAEAVLAHPAAAAFLEAAGHAETTVFAEHDGLDLKCRFDFLADEHPIAVDVKTTSGKASVSGFARSAAEWKYHVQRGHYLDVLERATGRVVEMVFVVVETSGPYGVGVRQLDRDFAEMGMKEALKARALYRECMETGVWPAYEQTVTLVPPPAWAIYEHEDRFGDDQ